MQFLEVSSIIWQSLERVKHVALLHQSHRSLNQH